MHALKPRLGLITLLLAVATFGWSTTAAADDNCVGRRGIIWSTANEMVGVLPGVGTATKLGVAISKAVRNARCQRNGVDQLTMEQLRSEITAISGQVVDEALRIRLMNAANTLVRVIEPFQSQLERVDQLDAAARRELASKLEELAIEAVFLESDTRNLNWPILPVYVQVASLKLGLYQLAYELREPGEARDTLSAIIAAERQESIEVLAHHERRFADKAPTVRRDYDGRQMEFEIETKVTNGDVTVLEEHWFCSKTWFQPRKCTNRETRRHELFNRARDRFRQLRTRQMQVIDADYLAFKNALFHAKRPAFALHPGSNTPPGAGGRVAPLCLSASSGGGFALQLCADLSVASDDLLWGVLPRTGQLYSLGARGCLQATDDGRLASGPCEPLADDQASAQRWGYHPAGYLIHRSTGRCLNLARDVAVKPDNLQESTPGTGVRLSPCDFGSIGYRQAIRYYKGYSTSHDDVLDSDLGEDVWAMVPTTRTDW